MRAIFLLLPIALVCSFLAISAGSQEAQPPPPANAPAPPVSQPAPSANQPQDQAAPSPSAPPQRSAADLEKLVGPIALYPDPLIAVMLPAACYPLEIVEAARFVADTNNVSKIDSQPWDENVKAVAKVPEALKKLNDDLRWTADLGQAFIDQQKDVMDTIQTLRKKASEVGTLQTSPQQTVVTTNAVVEQNTGGQIVTVTNEIVQIQPANPEVIYVPQYVPTAVYSPPPAYVPNPVAPLVTFGVGMAVGAVIANNNCDWGHGGVYVGHGGWGGYHGGGYHGNANINANINRNVNVNQNFNAANRTQWKPDSTRLRSAGAPGAASSYQSREARGYPAADRQASANTAARQPSGNNAAASGNAARANAAPRQNATPPANRPNPPAQRQANAAASRPAASSSGQSAFSGVKNGGATAQNVSQRGAASRSAATGAAPRTGGGGAGRGGGGGGGRRR